MNRRTFGAGSLVRRLVIVGVLAAFCLVMFGPSVQAYSRDQVKTQMTIMPKASDDPWGGDRIAPVRETWYSKFLTIFGLRAEPKPKSDDVQGTGTKNGSTPATTIAR